jgi:phosphonoacetate hydrolase
MTNFPSKTTHAPGARPKIVSVNGRDYRWPREPLVVICCDGSEPAYMEAAMAEGLMPHLQRIVSKGENLRGLCAMPSFTNPNNLSIATGRPPAWHGISGNYLIDPESGKEVMMNDPKWLRAPTIFAAFQKAGASVIVITAKDKLRLLLGKGLLFDGSAICFSSEKADEANEAENGVGEVCRLVGMKVPEVYSAELSEFVLAAGVKLIDARRPQVSYLSTTDYVQHKFPPGSKGANDFYRMLDRYLGQLDTIGASIVLTADHGMRDKHLPSGAPDVIYLQDELDRMFGDNATRVILPITDPYVVHHGALGSFATVYVHRVSAERVAGAIHDMEGIDLVLERKEACSRFELPEDRVGDLIVISGGPRATKVIGTSRGRHDLSALREPLRSHGGLSEQVVPIITNRKTVGLSGVLRNFDAFAIGCNHFAELAEAAE